MPSPTAAEWNPSDRTKPATEPADGTFEVGLVLAGAISAGAYIAGVMDFIIEALDQWEAAKQDQIQKGLPPNQWNVPCHKTLLRVITGASGGAMNAAIAGAALPWKYPHISMKNVPAKFTPGVLTGNPFFDAWVNQIDISDLLSNSDLSTDRSKLFSILNSDHLSQIAESAISQPANSTPLARPWCTNPLRICLTLGNLRGIPYGVSFNGAPPYEHGMVAHGDHARFALQFAGQSTTDLPAHDEMVLTPPATSADSSWHQLRTVGLASGAFPVFLRARKIDRPFADYTDRVVRETNGSPESIPPSPVEDADPLYEFMSVDGGTFDNEPFELAHHILAGAKGTNERDGTKAKRAVAMIDPFPEIPTLADVHEGDLMGQAGALINAWTMQSRFKVQDLELAKANEVYSRFLMTPDRGAGAPISGGFHLAAGVLGGFGGFLSWSYRRHDYLLGRRNAEWFLRKHFTLPESNPLFNGWNPALRDAHYAPADPGDTQRHLPIIPLVSLTTKQVLDGQVGEPLPTWPKGAFDVDSIHDAYVARFDKVWFKVLEMLKLNVFQETYLGPAHRALRDTVIWTKLRETIHNDMVKRKL